MFSPALITSITLVYHICWGLCVVIWYRSCHKRKLNTPVSPTCTHWCMSLFASRTNCHLYIKEQPNDIGGGDDAEAQIIFHHPAQLYLYSSSTKRMDWWRQSHINNNLSIIIYMKITCSYSPQTQSIKWLPPNASFLNYSINIKMWQYTL